MDRDKWTAQDAARAEGQGWILSERNDGYLEIQRDDEKESFDTDFKAYVNVKWLADRGSEMHKKAIRLHGTKWRD